MPSPPPLSSQPSRGLLSAHVEINYGGYSHLQLELLVHWRVARRARREPPGSPTASERAGSRHRAVKGKWRCRRRHREEIVQQGSSLPIRHSAGTISPRGKLWNGRRLRAPCTSHFALCKVMGWGRHLGITRGGMLAPAPLGDDGPRQKEKRVSGGTLHGAWIRGAVSQGDKGTAGNTRQRPLSRPPRGVVGERVHLYPGLK